MLAQTPVELISSAIEPRARTPEEEVAARDLFVRTTEKLRQSTTRQARRLTGNGTNGWGPRSTIAALCLALITTGANTFNWFGERERSQGALEETVSQLRARVAELEKRAGEQGLALVKLDTTVSTGFLRLDTAIGDLTDATRGINSELRRARQRKRSDPLGQGMRTGPDTIRDPFDHWITREGKQ